MNSTGNHVPIFVNADPDTMPSIKMSLANAAGSDAAIQEGVFMGNLFAMNPPVGLYAKAKGFKASIPGRLDASSSNPYKPIDGFRVDNGNWYSGNAGDLCLQKDVGDGEHSDFKSCTSWDQGYGGGGTKYDYGNVITTYVNSNYNGKVSQDFVARTINFDGEGVGRRTNSQSDIWTTSNNFEFQNTVYINTTGVLEIVDISGGRWLCQGGWNEHIVITKNTGEPFSLTSLSVGYWGSPDMVVTIRGYVKGSSSVRVQTVSSPSNAGTNVDLHWDNLLKVQIKGPRGNCIDNVNLRT